MRRLISILVAALTFLAATAQVQLKVKTNDGAVSTYNGFYEMEFNDSAKTVDLYADSAATLETICHGTFHGRQTIIHATTCSAMGLSCTSEM